MLGALTRLYHLIYRVATDVPDHWTDRAILARSPEDRLRIDTAETGDSIKLKLKTGWMPAFDVDDGDLVVEVPRGALSVAATILLVSGAINSGTSSVRNVLDIMKERNEIRMQTLQEDKLQLELEELRSKIREADDTTTKKMDKVIRSIFRFTVENDDVFSVELLAGGDVSGE